MAFEDARLVPDGAVLTTDVCVVGSGAAGLTLARQLVGSSRRVIVLEAGGMKRDPVTEDVAFDLDLLGLPQNSTVASRGRWFGGSTNLWFGRIATLERIDFEQRPWVPHSGWPLSFDELQKWLGTAAAILEVPNFDKIDIDAWGPNPTTEMVVRDGGADLGVFLWADGMFMGERCRDLIERSTNVQMMLNATAVELVPNESSSRIQSLTVCGSGSARFAVKATDYVLAAGGLENPRLLLASTRRSAAGVGNESDTVGRYYMDHPRGEGLAEADLRGLPRHVLQRLLLLGEKALSPHGKVQLRVTFPEAMQRSEQLLNHSLHAHLVTDMHQAPGYEALRRLVARDRAGQAGGSATADLWQVAKSGPQLASFGVRKLVRRERLTSLVVIDQLEQAPDPLSRVTVDHRRLDRFGLPRLQLDWRVSELTYSGQRRMHALVRTMLKSAGIETFRSSILDGGNAQVPLLDMKHPSGTTRMSLGQRDGVVDTDCRVHGVSNLFVAGSSVFPTVGHANPTLTIVALAARLARHLGGLAATSGPPSTNA
jgi:choline dehydrogenase-like flavoprotein